MRVGRFITPYYGSIGIGKSLRALSLTLATGEGDEARAELTRAVRSGYASKAAGVFSFGSARGALAALLQGAGIGDGDRVVVSAYSCLAVPTAVLAAGAMPVYSDIDPLTLNADVARIEAAMTPRVRAVIVQHTLGSIAPVGAIVEHLRGKGILVIEDCALSVGSRGEDGLVGLRADAAVFSMELSKTISCGWGGVAIVNEPALAAKMARFYETVQEPAPVAQRRDSFQTAVAGICNTARLFDPLGKYVLHAGFQAGLFRRSTPAPEFEGIVAPDFVTRMGAPQARLAAAQWSDLDVIAARCVGNAARIRSGLRDLGLPMPGAPRDDEVSVTPRVSFLLDNRDAAVRYFASRGVELGTWFSGPMSPLPRSPKFNYHPGAYAFAKQVAARIVNLPCHSRISASEVDSMLGILGDFLRSAAGSGVEKRPPVAGQTSTFDSNALALS